MSDKTECCVCFRRCMLAENETGVCGIRKNIEGRLIDLSYGRISEAQVLSASKVPLTGAGENAQVLALSGTGCNMFCKACPREKAARPEGNGRAETILPEEMTDYVLGLKKQGVAAVFFDRPEPLLSWEYVRDVSRLLEARGIKTYLTTNGSVSEKVLEYTLPCIDAVSVRMKGFSKECLRRSGGDADSLRRTLELCSLRRHTEAVYEVIPGVNDDEEEAEAAAEYLSYLSYGFPLHFEVCGPVWREYDPDTVGGILNRYALKASCYLKNVYVRTKKGRRKVEAVL